MKQSILTTDDCESFVSSAIIDEMPGLAGMDASSDAALMEMERLRKTAFVGDVLSPIEDAWEVLQ